MMNVATGEIGSVLVETTQNRGATPEELAERATNKIIQVGGKSHPAVTAQALAFREEIYVALLFYFREAVNSHKVTLVHRFKEAGHPELIRLLDE